MTDTTSDPIAFTSDDDSNVVDMHQHVVQQNAALIDQLAAVGHQPDRLLVVQTSFEVLLDVLFDEPDELARFHIAVDLALNQKLRAAIDGLTSALVLPDDMGA